MSNAKHITAAIGNPTFLAIASLITAVALGYWLGVPSTVSKENQNGYWHELQALPEARATKVPANILSNFLPVTKQKKREAEPQPLEAVNENFVAAIDPADPNTWRLAGVIYQSEQWNALLVTDYDSVQKVAQGEMLENGTTIIHIDKQRLAWQRGENEQGTLWLYGTPHDDATNTVPNQEN